MPAGSGSGPRGVRADRGEAQAAAAYLAPAAAGSVGHRGGQQSLALAELVQDPELRAELQRAVDDANTLVSRPESIRRFRVLARDLTEARGHLTPSLKLRRAAIAADFADEIEALYAAR